MHQSSRRPTALRRPILLGLAAALVALPSSTILAQQSSAPAAVAAPAVAGPSVGDVAPDFELRGATRFGLLRDPLRLSDFRGQTVVLAFFYKARTKG